MGYILSFSVLFFFTVLLKFPFTVGEVVNRVSSKLHFETLPISIVTTFIHPSFGVILNALVLPFLSKPNSQVCTTSVCGDVIQVKHWHETLFLVNWMALLMMLVSLVVWIKNLPWWQWNWILNSQTVCSLLCSLYLFYGKKQLPSRPFKFFR